MQKRLWIVLGCLAIFLIPPRLGAAQGWQEQPRNLLEAERIVAVTGGGLFPVLNKLDNGTLAAVVRGGAGHTGVGGRLDLITSLDGGINWAAPSSIVNTLPDSRNPAFGQAADGNLVVAYSVTGPYDVQGNFVFDTSRYTMWVTRSNDNGGQWTPPQQIDTAPFQYASPYGKIVTLPDGALLMGLYGWYLPDEEGGVLPPEQQDQWMAAVSRSEDNGVTWSHPNPIVGYIPGRTTNTSYSEIGLVALPGGDVLAAMRGGSTDGVDQVLSTDGGLTWGPIETVIPGLSRQPADVIQLNSGRLLLTYGRRTPGANGVEAALSYNVPGQWDGLAVPAENPRPQIPSNTGQQWDWQTHVSLEWNAASADTGYPSSVQLDDGTIVTMYYGNGEVGNPNAGLYAKVVRYHEADLLTPPPSPTVSADFSFGFGATDPLRDQNAWTTNETSIANTPTTQGDFSFSPALPTSNRFDGSGLLFPFRVITDASADPASTTSGQTGADPSAGFPNGLTVPITASYNGPVPADASGTPDFKLMIEITSISIWGGHHSQSSTPPTLAWEEVTAGHAQTSPAVTLPPGTTAGLDRKTLSNYAQLVWDPDDFATPLAGLNDSFTRTFGIVDRLTLGDLRFADGIEVEGRVHLIYNTGGVLGDYNLDGTVNAADYTVWRDTRGSTGNLAADGDGNGAIELADYDVWKTNFGNTAGSGSSSNAAMPEPTSLLLLIGLTAFGMSHRSLRVC